MAEHKVVNVTQLDADLTSIANAIRNRAGTSAKIEFPTGFVNTIRSIPVNMEVGEEIEVENLSQVHYWTKTGMVGGTINETYRSTDVMLGYSSDTIQYADEVVLEGNNLTLVNPRYYTLATDDDAAEEILVGKYVYALSKFYRIPSDAAIVYYAPTQYVGGHMNATKAYELSVTAGSEERITIVVSNDITAYPENGEQGGFTYVYQGSVNESDIQEVAQATPTISVSTNGLITATVTQEAGLVGAGTKSATKQLSTQSAQTITPGTSNKTISSGKYLTGTQTIQGDANLKAENIKKGVSIFGVAGSHECEGGTETIVSGQYCWRKHRSKVYELTTEALGTTKPADCGSTGYVSYTVTDDGYFQLNSGSASLDLYYLPVGATNANTKYVYFKKWKYSTSGSYDEYSKLTLSDTYTETKGDFLGYVISDDSAAYPEDGIAADGYWYVEVTE